MEYKTILVNVYENGIIKDARTSKVIAELVDFVPYSGIKEDNDRGEDNEQSNA